MQNLTQSQSSSGTCKPKALFRLSLDKPDTEDKPDMMDNNLHRLVHKYLATEGFFFENNALKEEPISLDGLFILVTKAALSVTKPASIASIYDKISDLPVYVDYPYNSEVAVGFRAFETPFGTGYASYKDSGAIISSKDEGKLTTSKFEFHLRLLNGAIKSLPNNEHNSEMGENNALVPQSAHEIRELSLSLRSLALIEDAHDLKLKLPMGCVKKVQGGNHSKTGLFVINITMLKEFVNSFLAASNSNKKRSANVLNDAESSLSEPEQKRPRTEGDMDSLEKHPSISGVPGTLFQPPRLDADAAERQTAWKEFQPHIRRFNA